MRYLFIEHHPVFGGPHARAIRLAEPLARRGWEVTAVLPDEPGTVVSRMQDAGLRVASIPLHRPRRHLSSLPTFAVGFLKDVARIRRVIEREKADIVLVAGLESPQGVLAGWLSGVPVVWQLNGTQTPLTYRRMMMRLAQRCTGAVMTTGTRIALEHPGITNLQERWIPFLTPVDADQFTPSEAKRSSAREELRLRQDDVVIGAIGNVNPQKGYGTFIEAAGLLRREHPGVRFAILGTCDQNHARHQNALWTRAGELGMKIGVDLIIRDAGTRVEELACAFDILWCSSLPRSEGVSNAVIESMALKLPVVVTDVGGMRDIVADGVTGFVVPPLDATALVAATQELIENPTRRAEIGEAARKFVLENCRIEHCVDAYLRAFKLASGRRHGNSWARASIGPSSDGQNPRALQRAGRPSIALPDPLPVVVDRNRKGRARRLRKFIRLAARRHQWGSLRHGVAAAIEHESVPFAYSFASIIDVGAHHGQFALFARYRYPGARIHCVEPLPEAVARLKTTLPQGAVLHPFAAAGVSGSRKFHVSRCTDSSSLLPISDLYTTAFPGTEEARVAVVDCRRLDDFLEPRDLVRPCLLKIDVQGSELEVLEGAGGILDCVDEVFVECSFVEFYRGQVLIDDVVSYLRAREFRLAGVFSVVRDAAGRCLQADLLFRRLSPSD